MNAGVNAELVRKHAHDLARIQRRAAEVAKRKQTSFRDAELELLRAEYKAVHAKWTAARTQLVLPV